MIIRLIFKIFLFCNFFLYKNSKKNNHDNATIKKSLQKAENSKQKCSIFGYLIAKTLKKDPHCTENDLNLPKGEQLFEILSTLSSLAEEGNIDLKNIFDKEIVIVKKSKIRESCRKLEKTLKSFGNSTDHFIISLLTTFSPILIQINGGKFDMAPLTKLIKKYSDSIEIKKEDYSESFLNYKKLIWQKKNIIQSKFLQNKELFKCDEEIKKKYKIDSKSYGILNKKNAEKIINISRDSIPARGFVNTSFFKEKYQQQKKKFKDNLQKLQHIDKNIENDFKLDNKISGINSILKALQINYGKLLDKKFTNDVLIDYNNSKVKLPDLKKKIFQVMDIDKQNLSKEKEKYINNLHNISKIVFYRSKILKRIGLFPKQFINKYGKLMHLKLFSFKDKKNLKIKLDSILQGNNNNTKSLIVTPLIFLETKDKYNAQYCNVLNSFKNGTYLVEDSTGERFIPTLKYKKNLLELMKLNLKDYLLRGFKEILGIIDNIIGEKNRDKILNEMCIFVNHNMGNLKENCYCFLVADPNNIL